MKPNNLILSYNLREDFWFASAISGETCDKDKITMARGKLCRSLRAHAPAYEILTSPPKLGKREVALLPG